MLAHQEEWDLKNIGRMVRAQLIGMLLEFNNVSTFRFTRAWLERQWTDRLRTLLAGAWKQYHETQA